ncbi:GSCOCG00011240001-RA-CDS, partial [Cotesia congregata]
MIRQTIHGFYAEKMYPSLEMVHKKLQECEHIPDFKLTTLKTWCKKLNFSYKKFNKKPVWMESVSVAAQRDTYLRQIAHYRENGYNIFYTDESWCGANHSRKYGWIETIQSSEINNFDSDRCRSGKRVIILDIGGVNGFVPGCRLCFIGKKGSDDYHNEMNAEHYLKWFQKVLQVLPDKSVIILDQAPYHKMLDPEFRNPTTGWRKQKIIEWLVNRPVPLPQNINEFADLTKNELLQLAKLYRYPPQYLLEKIAQEKRGNEVKLLWLPVAHCEYNPIELIWAYVKNDAAKNNSTFKINDALKLCTNAMENIPPSSWPDCIEHAKKEEAK